MDIVWERIETRLDGDGSRATWTYLDQSDETEYPWDFQVLRSPAWGDAPKVDLLESLGVVGWMPRGAGNADPYIYVFTVDSDDPAEGMVALLDTSTL